MTTAVRATVQALDQDLPLVEVQTLAGAIERSRWFLVVFGTRFSVFGLIGWLMASVGIYAVIAQATGRRTQEIGVRMALGAGPRDVAWRVEGQAAAWVVRVHGCGVRQDIGRNSFVAKRSAVRTRLGKL